MTRTSCLCFLLLSLTLSGCATRMVQGPDEGPLRIRVASDGWEEARVVDVQAVIDSTAEVLLAAIPNHPPLALHVTNGDDGPMVFAQKNLRGEYRVQLNVHGRYWAQLAYQFSHELCHVLTNFDARHGNSADTRWFDEALCEAVSLYTLTGMAERWTYAPPYPNWADYHGALYEYVGQIVARHEAIYPGEQAFVPWFIAHEPRLRAEPYDRTLTGIISLRLYRVIMQNPQGLAAIVYLNRGTPGSSLPELMQQWHTQVPSNQRPFVRAVARALGVTIVTGRKEIAV